ncbi:MAG: 2-succinyl-5-enolpyruvyl-6-hydroxy-3-cyclohexene-1-carboxylic-acid synthase [Chloroflexi bacterium]|nr:2-succinyl-5-enolpyruvyl-6-hydroxy-3-cyclohexene-1-carboxylic-acid synthase [Chloroflexota bacterium]
MGMQETPPRAQTTGPAPSSAGAIAQLCAQICAEKGVQHFIISPGSRSAPLTIALSRHPQIACRIVYDERSAAYVALGMAQQLGQPVGLLCTSGTATLNYGPAVTEAFYQQIPLLVFTADRPPEWIDQQDNQAIHQTGLYEPHCRGSYELPVEFNHPDARWFATRILAQAIDHCQAPTPGPVHINVPLREPLYTPVTEQPAPPIIQTMAHHFQLTEPAWTELISLWQRARRKLIIGGMHAANPTLQASLRALSADPTVAVIGDITANLYPDGTQLYHSDMILGTRNAAMIEQLQPDLVITFGGQYISKYLRGLLRLHPPRAQWHLQLEGNPVDTLQCLTHVIPMRPVDFFPALQQRIQPSSRGDYGAFWQALEEQTAAKLTKFLQTAPFGEFQAVQQVMQALPADSHLQIGNSMPIRYANFIGHIPGRALAQINANRGTSGIDGTVSTTVGAALASSALTTLITGDLAFFYDRNGLWQPDLPKNLRVVILNNHGGGIFQIIDGPNQLAPDELRTYFLTPQPLTARRTAEDHQCDYYFVDKRTDLTAALADFFAPRARAAILEIETDMQINTQVFEQFRALVAE